MKCDTDAQRLFDLEIENHKQKYGKVKTKCINVKEV